MKKYNVIYADPPWRYKLWTGGGAADEHYPTMSIEDIKALPVDKLAAKDCALFLWITFPMLHEAWDVMRAWGFDFKTVAFVWIKLNRTADTLFWGMGHWTRANAEICLLATKGKPKRVSKSVHQICDARIMEHSRKPDEIRDRIVQLCGDLPRIELFSRQISDGWDCWGNEIYKFSDCKKKGGADNA